MRDMTVKLIAPLALVAAGPLRDLLNEVADRERAEVEAEVEKRRRDKNRQYEAEYYSVPVEMLKQLDDLGIPWRRLVAIGPFGLTSVSADSPIPLAASDTAQPACG